VKAVSSLSPGPAKVLNAMLASYGSVLPSIEKRGDICPFTFENEGTFSKP